MKSIAIENGTLAVEERGEGTPLLLVHGFPLSHAMWLAQLEDLSADFRVIAPDLRGFGNSPLRPSGAEGNPSEDDPGDLQSFALTMDGLADDLNRLLDALEISEPIVFCGLSMGGYIAWPFWKKHAARLRAMILCDTRAGGDTDEALSNRLRMAEGVVRWGSSAVAAPMASKLFAPETYEKTPEIVGQVRETIASTNPWSIAAAQLGMAQRPDMTDSLPRIQVPTLLVCGEHDTLSPPNEMRKIADAMPLAEYVEIAGAGHMAPMEQPAEVNAAIRRFLFAIDRRG